MQILWGIDLNKVAGETALLLGANSVGKTTTLRSIIGLLPCWRGEILLGGEPLQHLKPSERIRRGIGFMSETGVFPDFSIVENIRLGRYFLDDAEVRRAASDFLMCSAISPNAATAWRRVCPVVGAKCSVSPKLSISAPNFY